MNTNVQKSIYIVSVVEHVVFESYPANVLVLWLFWGHQIFFIAQLEAIRSVSPDRHRMLHLSDHPLRAR